jgi:hypothetical protein
MVLRIEDDTEELKRAWYWLLGPRIADADKRKGIKKRFERGKWLGIYANISLELKEAI